jgi:hypothetical protein
MPVILYARVSTAEQKIGHRTANLGAGFVIDGVAADHGVLGISTSLAESPRVLMHRSVRVFKPNAHPSTVLGNELNPGIFQCHSD